jgi:Spy/CpxP family protein refolding chaperone
MNSWKVIPAVMVIFGAGVLTGGLLVNYVDHAHPEQVRFPFWRSDPHSQMDNPGQPHPGELPRPRSPEMWRKDFIGHLDEALKLTPEQHAAISKIIAEGQEQNREIWTNVAPKMRQEMEQVHQRIRSELTPDQQKQFETLTKQFAPRHPPHDQAPPGSPPPTANVPPPPPDGVPGP